MFFNRFTLTTTNIETHKVQPKKSPKKLVNSKFANRSILFRSDYNTSIVDSKIFPLYRKPERDQDEGCNNRQVSMMTYI